MLEKGRKRTKMKRLDGVTEALKIFNGITKIRKRQEKEDEIKFLLISKAYLQNTYVLDKRILK